MYSVQCLSIFATSKYIVSRSECDHIFPYAVFCLPASNFRLLMVVLLLELESCLLWIVPDSNIPFEEKLHSDLNRIYFNIYLKYFHPNPKQREINQFDAIMKMMHYLQCYLGHQFHLLHRKIGIIILQYSNVVKFLCS